MGEIIFTTVMKTYSKNLEIETYKHRTVLFQKYCTCLVSLLSSQCIVFFLQFEPMTEDNKKTWDYNQKDIPFLESEINHLETILFDLYENGLETFMRGDEGIKTYEKETP